MILCLQIKRIVMDGLRKFLKNLISGWTRKTTVCFVTGLEFDKSEVVMLFKCC